MPTEQIQKLTFKKLIMTIGNLPSSYVDSMSYYECLLWLCNYLENTVIPAVNNNGEAVEELQELYVQLKTFVDTYFENLDVQEEINVKLDEMAEDGTLTNLIKNYIDPIFTTYVNNTNEMLNEFKNATNQRLTAQDSAISSIDDRVTSATSGSPKGVYATAAALTSANPDHNYIYLVLEDGKWYYYDTTNTAWTAGGVYQSTSLADYEVFTQNFESNIQSRIGDTINYRSLTYTEDIGKVMSWNGTINNLSNFNYVVIDVKEHDIVYIDTYNESTNKPNYNLLNGTTVTYHSPDMNTSENRHFQETVTIPSGVNKIAVNYSRLYNHSITIKNVINGVELNNDVNDIKNVIAPFKEILPVDEGNDYISVNISAKTITFNEFSTYQWKKYDVENISKAYLDYVPIPAATIYGIIFTDSSNVVITCDDYQPNMGSSEIAKYIYKPIGAKYLYIQTSASNKLELSNREYLTTEDISNENMEDQSYEIEQLQRRCTNLEEQNPFEWKPFDKTYFAFVIDDCNAYLPKAVEIFHSNNIPLSSATIINRLNTVWTEYTPDNTKTVKELLNDMVSDGGEVLSHYGGNLAPAGTPDTPAVHYLTTPEDWLERTRDVKKTLNENGFVVRGIITADRTIPETSTGQYYCSLYFDYSDTLGTSKNFHLGRRKFFLDSDMQTLAGAKAYIDSCCQTPGFYPFCFHGTRQDEPLINENDLNELLSYINAKGSSVCVCTTYSNVIDEFGSTMLAEQIRELQ